MSNLFKELRLLILIILYYILELSFHSKCFVFQYFLCYQQEHWSGYPFPSPGDLPSPGTEPRSPTLQVDSLPSEPPGKPQTAGVGCLALLQRSFLTQEQELNWGLLHCRRILYQLSYQGSLLKSPTLILFVYISSLRSISLA